MVSQPIGPDEEKILSWFPKLNPKSLTITSPETPFYNCVAYAAGEMHRVWWPDPLKTMYWPPGAPRTVTIMAFQSAFETLGYQICTNEYLETGFEKIAFFHKKGAPKHVAKQLSNGTWTSKLGPSFDVSHDLRGLESNDYGVVGPIMKRPLGSYFSDDEF